MNVVVPVYSIAKPYTAIAVLRSLELDAVVGDHVAGLRDDLAALTFRALLTHRSGLDDYGGWPVYRDAVEARLPAWPEERILDRAEVGPPGTFRYSNVGYLLLRRALEEVHGSSFFGVLTDLVLGPLDVAAHPFASPADWQHCHHPGIDERLRAYDPGWVYTGTFAAEPDEAARGLALVMRGALGDEVARALRGTLAVDVPATHPMTPAGYGFGVMTSGDPVRVIGHGGGGPGFTLFAATDVEGARWRGEVAASGSDDLELVRRCVTAVRPARGEAAGN